MWPRDRLSYSDLNAGESVRWIKAFSQALIDGVGADWSSHAEARKAASLVADIAATEERAALEIKQAFDPYGASIPSSIPRPTGTGGGGFLAAGPPAGISSFAAPIPANRRDVLDVLRQSVTPEGRRVVRFLFNTWNAQADEVKDQELRNAVTTGELSGPVFAQWRRDYVRMLNEQMIPSWRRMIEAGSDTILNPQPFSVLRNVDDWINARGGELIVDITEQQRLAVRGLLRHFNVNQPLSPHEMGRMLRPVVGLTQRQSGAVRRLHQTLTDQGLPRRAVLHQVGNYATRLRRFRAERIARTETAFAFNFGQHAQMRQKIEDGEFSGPVVKTWLTAQDELVCPWCAPLNGQQIGFEETYPAVTKRIPNTLVPPAHPMCRCSISYDVVGGLEARVLAGEEPDLPPEPQNMPLADMRAERDSLTSEIEAWQEANMPTDPFQQTLNPPQFPNQLRVQRLNDLQAHIADREGWLATLSAAGRRAGPDALESSLIGLTGRALAARRADAASLVARWTAPVPRRPRGEAAGIKAFDRARRARNGVGLHRDLGDIEGHQVFVEERDGEWFVRMKVTAQRGETFAAEFGGQSSRYRLTSRSGDDDWSMTSQRRELDSGARAHWIPPGQDNKWSWSNTLELRIRATSAEEAFNMARDGLGELGINFRPPTPTARRELARRRLANIWSTRAAQANAAGTPLTREQLREDMSGFEDLLDNVERDARYVAGGPGDRVLYSPALAEAAERFGDANHLYHQGGREGIVAVLSGGRDAALLSTNRRFQQGFFTTGMSSFEDMRTGGADNVFTRLSSSGPHFSNWGEPKVILDRRMLGRMDWYAFRHDEYGTSNPTRIPERSFVGEGFNLQSNSSSNEIMFRGSVGSQWIRGVVVSQEDREFMLRELRSRGVRKIRGVEIDRFIVTRTEDLPALPDEIK